jgi:hypothetical protein
MLKVPSVLMYLSCVPIFIAVDALIHAHRTRSVHVLCSAPYRRVCLGSTVTRAHNGRAAHLVLFRAVPPDDVNGAEERHSLGPSDRVIRSRLLHSIGLAHQGRGAYEDALRLYEEALEAWPASLASLYHCGLMQYALHRFTNAETILDTLSERVEEESARGCVRLVCVLTSVW